MPRIAHDLDGTERESAMLPMRVAVLACLASALVTCTTWADDDTKRYLADDGKLKHALHIKDVLGDNFSISGTYLRVQPDGHWSSGRITHGKLLEEKKGKLSREEIVELAKALAKSGLHDLRDEGTGVRN